MAWTILIDADVEKDLQRIHQLSQQIEKTPNVKAATDLNSRLIVEVAYLETEMLKLQSLLNQQLAQGRSEGIAQQTRSATFNTLPDLRARE